MSNSSRSLTEKKPRKPYRDFPLFAHGNGQWCKKIRGRHRFFGIWTDPDKALKKYLDEKDDLHAGRRPREKRDGLTVRDLCNRLLTLKRNLADTRELAERFFDECQNLLLAASLDRALSCRHARELLTISRGSARRFAWASRTLGRFEGLAATRSVHGNRLRWDYLQPDPLENLVSCHCSGAGLGIRMHVGAQRPTCSTFA
jgi:hypothetical protein